ncbi:ATP-dependent DNA helicase RecG [Georgenia sp. TF02-10]|uniref:ATP-dependent DNA helicase RecG n=1 Tax=Georgenia sp. TF02-10 TaxID=2917725 RepID=UPI001FA7FED4|nr:ATP-dependent DNA helicase RecG [Georgenia sp. TF02-10]UNX53860.1 ATP-dependent DNA helicase RecG [Georgenia sp. TF02-10]
MGEDGRTAGTGTPPASGARHDPAVVGEGTGPLGEPLAKLVGAPTGRALGKLGLEVAEDLLRHYPRRYDHRAELSPLGRLRPGEDASVIARVAAAHQRPMRSRPGFILSVTITDGVNRLELTFFAKRAHALTYHREQLRPGVTAIFYGKVQDRYGTRQLLQPEFETLPDLDAEAAAVERIDAPIPVYPSAAGVRSRVIRECAGVVLDQLRPEDVPDPLPAAYRAAHRLPGLYETFRLLHRPHSDREWQRAQHRLRHEEAFVLQTALAQRRAVTRAQVAVARPPSPGGIREALLDRLPFTLTAGQREIGAVLAEEIAQPVPMMRLLQGEVGSGKTVVALLAMLQVVDAGGQAALLAPTEVLAQQHHRSITALLGPLAEAGLLGGAEHATRVALLTGSQGATARRQALAAAASGEAGIVIGTHALLGEQVQLADLGLVVVDEQHRFGVEQRDALRGKAATTPHLLVMTATPIPRTVAMTSFGDLETSTLRELPVGRPGVSTTVVPAWNERWMQRVWERVREEVDAGGRAYVVCPRLTPGEQDAPGVDDGVGPGVTDLLDLVDATRPPVAAVPDVAAHLGELPALSGVAVGQMHGQLPPDAKDAAMAAFAAGATPVLVTTTVIEVGVDVPDATVMVILDADRFGLSQLHQLRGRVGRGTRPGVCLAVSHAPPGSEAGRRLEAFATTPDGFVLAETDLRLRREGDVLGAAQSGRSSSLRLLRVLTDSTIIDEARAAARDLIARDPELTTEPALAAAVARRVDEDAAAYLERS